LSKDLGTNLKLSTNKNIQFHWIFLLGPLSKVALISISPPKVKLNPKGDVLIFRIEILKWNYYLSKISKLVDVKQIASII
jgi:hypothetical protein